MQTDNSQSVVIWTLIIGFLTSISASIIAMWKDSRTQKAADKKAEKQRQWDLEDRRDNNAKLLAATETVATEVKKATVIADEKREILASVVEINAAEILHHAKQPVFDFLIDKFKDPGTMSDQEMVQFIQRLEIIANDTRQKTPQQPAARMMLDRALAVARGRNLKVSTRAELGENRAAGEAMRVEAEPNKGRHDDGEKTPETGAKSEQKAAEKVVEKVLEKAVEKQTQLVLEKIEAATIEKIEKMETGTVEIHADSVSVGTPKEVVKEEEK